MHLYNLTLQTPTAITQAIVGNFSGIRQQEIIISRGTILELLRPDSSTGKVSTVLAQDVFGTIRSIAAFRLTGGTKDYCIVGSDSGRIIVLEYDPKTNSFLKLQQETFGKSGSRRIVPGEMLAVDPKGRSVMISAVEKSKLVYVLNRDAAANLTISSPLEAHRNGALIHAIVGVDVGFENPLFAALEVDYTESDADPTGQAFKNAEKMLTFYELDLGLNHVVRKHSEPTDRRANLLVQVPGGQSATTNAFDGPSGVLVCCEDHIIYRPVDMDGGAISHRVPIPKRRSPWGGDEERGLIITSAVMHKMKGAFFFLLQSEIGDLYKVTLEHEEETVKSMTIKYFDTVPIASSLCILKSGFLFVAAEGGNHHLYQFQKLGDDDAEPEFTSTSYPHNGISSSPLPACYFRPHPLDNLVLADEMTSFCPILDARILNLFGPTSGVPVTLQSDTPQIYLTCGRGARSSFRMLRHGLEVEESVSSELPGVPNGVWTVKVNNDDQYDKYIILSFVNGTLVLSIGETIEEVADTGFLSSAPTLAVQQLADNGGLIQAHPGGVRHVRPSQGDSAAGVTEWRAPQGRQVASATTNSRQVCVALNSGELVYFELDLNGVLQEYGEMRAVGSAVVCMSIAEVPEGRQRSPYLAVGCEDQTVRIISLDPESTLETISLQALTAPPTSICIAEMLDASIDKNMPTLFVNIGLSNGVLLRTVLDPVNGQLTDTRTRFLGTRPVRLVRVSVQRNTCILALSSRSWLNYTHQNLLRFSPLIYENLDHAWSFSAELCPEGLIGIAGSVLRIFQIPKLSDKLKQVTMPLSYTPRKIAVHPEHQLFYVIESDHRTWGSEAKNTRLEELKQAGKKIDQELVDLLPEEFGLPRAGAGQWASCIRIVDPTEPKTLFKVELDNNESAFSVAVVPFLARENELFLVVGTAKETRVSPRSCSTGYLRTYKILENGKRLELLHQTEVDDVPLALLGIKGRLCAGVGKALRIYEMGKKKLLRKSENKTFLSPIVTLTSQASRIIVGDMQESVHFATYKAESNRLLVFADDTSARWVTSATLVDYDTVAVGDKFGNIFVNRLPANVSQQVDDDPTGAGIMHEREFLHGAPHKTKLLAHYNVGDIVTSVHRAALVPGGRDVIVYTGLHGTIGVLIPLASKEDVDFITTLEQHMRSEQPSLVGRDHLAYRGYYVPVKAVVDGDLCERFAMLPSTKQKSIAGELDRTVGEVLKKLEGLRVAGINVLHTTDIHGWVLGHPKQVYPEMSWSGTFGDFYSFLFHMRNKAKDKHADLFLVDTGDRRIGHGLTDKLLDPKTVNGQAIVEMYLQLGYDAIVPGNHDLANPHVVEFIMNKFADQWNGRFITSNIHRLQPQKTRTESSAPEQLEFLGAPYRYWKTKNKNKIMAFGVVLSKARIADKLISVMPVSKMITEDWFKGALTLPTDVFMIIGHIDAKNPLPQDDMKLIHDAIRRVHPLKPIIIFAGHSHQRYCNRFTTPKGSFRSMILQSGRYFDTVGWMSTKLDNNSIEQDLVMKRRYLDNNVETYKYHADKTNDNFYTRKGRESPTMRMVLIGRKVSPKYMDYYLDRKPWTEKEDDPESLFSLYLDAAENVLIDKEVSPNWMFFSNWGVLRGDIYSGPFTLGDFYTISPNDPNPYLHVTVKRSVADQVIQQLQSGGRSKLQWTSAESRDSQPHGSQLGQFAQRPLSAHSSDSNPSNNLTYGWKTRDHCGEKGAEVYGEGDDVEHEPIPQVSFDNEPPVFFRRKSYKDTNLADDADIDLIFTNYIGKKVPDALNKITNSTKFNKDSIREYPSEIKQDKLLGLYIRSKFNTITSNIPFPE